MTRDEYHKKFEKIIAKLERLETKEELTRIKKALFFSSLNYSARIVYLEGLIEKLEEAKQFKHQLYLSELSLDPNEALACIKNKF